MCLTVNFFFKIIFPTLVRVAFGPCSNLPNPLFYHFNPLISSNFRNNQSNNSTDLSSIMLADQLSKECHLN